MARATVNTDSDSWPLALRLRGRGHRDYPCVRLRRGHHGLMITQAAPRPPRMHDRDHSLAGCAAATGTTHVGSNKYMYLLAYSTVLFLFFNYDGKSSYQVRF